MKLHPQIIEKKGKNEFVVLPFKEFETLIELMEDYEDLQDLRTAKEQSKGKNSISIDKVISNLGLQKI